MCPQAWNTVNWDTTGDCKQDVLVAHRLVCLDGCVLKLETVWIAHVLGHSWLRRLVCCVHVSASLNCMHLGAHSCDLWLRADLCEHYGCVAPQPCVSCLCQTLKLCELCMCWENTAGSCDWKLICLNTMDVLGSCVGVLVHVKVNCACVWKCLEHTVCVVFNLKLNCVNSLGAHRLMFSVHVVSSWTVQVVGARSWVVCCVLCA